MHGIMYMMDVFKCFEWVLFMYNVDTHSIASIRKELGIIFPRKCSHNIGCGHRAGASPRPLPGADTCNTSPH